MFGYFVFIPHFIKGHLYDKGKLDFSERFFPIHPILIKPGDFYLVIRIYYLDTN